MPLDSVILSGWSHQGDVSGCRYSGRQLVSSSHHTPAVTRHGSVIFTISHASHNKVWQETDQVCNVMIMTWYWDLHEHDPPPVSDSPALLPWPDKYHHRYPPGLPRSLLTSCRSVFWSCDLCGPSWRGPRTEPGAWWGRGAGPGWRMASQAAGWRARHRRNPRWWSPAQLRPGPGLKQEALVFLSNYFLLFVIFFYRPHHRYFLID